MDTRTRTRYFLAAVLIGAAAALLLNAIGSVTNW